MNLPFDEFSSILDAAVARVLADADITAPPVDAVALARRLGIDLDERPRRRAARTPAPLTPEQRQWSAARAIADHLRPELLRQLGVEGPTGLAGGSLGNRVAARLLVPSDWFGRDCRQSAFDLVALRERYRTAAAETIAWRWLDLPEPCVVAILAGGRPQRRRANAGRVPAKLSPAEERCAAAVRDSGEPQCLRLGGWTVHGWPISGGREVLRSVVDEDGI